MLLITPLTMIIGSKLYKLQQFKISSERSVVWNGMFNYSSILALSVVIAKTEVRKIPKLILQKLKIEYIER